MTDSVEQLAAELSRAFPHALRADVARVSAVLPEATHPLFRPFSVVLGAKSLSIPQRVYFPDPFRAVLERLSSTQRLILHCIYTRHHDGYVREQHLLPVLEAAPGWAAPFVLQLLGEYVIEIHDALLANIETVAGDSYRHFADQNPSFVALTKSRIVSYWTCYYRWSRYAGARVYPDLFKYPAYQVADALCWWRVGELSRLRFR
jgi:hypothetical protein